MTIVKAVASREGKADSVVASNNYRILEQIKPLVMDPSVGTFIHNVTMTLSCETPDVIIKYTTDGSKPTAASQGYDAERGINLEDDGVRRKVFIVRAIAMKKDMGDSDEVRSQDIVVMPQVKTPVIEPAADGT